MHIYECLCLHTLLKKRPRLAFKIFPHIFWFAYFHGPYTYTHFWADATETHGAHLLENNRSPGHAGPVTLRSTIPSRIPQFPEDSASHGAATRRCKRRRRQEHPRSRRESDGADQLHRDCGGGGRGDAPLHHRHPQVRRPLPPQRAPAPAVARGGHSLRRIQVSRLRRARALLAWRCVSAIRSLVYMECEINFAPRSLQYRIRCLGLGVISGSNCPQFSDIAVRPELSEIMGVAD